jgi:hypothetical protein
MFVITITNYSKVVDTRDGFDCALLSLILFSVREV